MNKKMEFETNIFTIIASGRIIGRQYLRLTPMWLDTNCFLNYFNLDNKLDYVQFETEIQSLEIELATIKEELKDMSETMKKYNPRTRQRNSPTLIIQQKIKQLQIQQQTHIHQSSGWIIDKNGNHIKSLDGIIHGIRQL